MVRLSDRLSRMASGKNVLGLFAVVALFELGFAKAAARLRELSGGVETLDARLSYTPETAYASVEAYGEQGRRLYTAVELTLDGAFPLIYPTLYSLLISYLFRRAFPALSPLQTLNLVPFAATLPDYAENLSIVTMLLAYPRRLTRLARLASAFTTTKWLAVLASTGLTVAGIAAFLYRRMKFAPTQSEISLR
jgi:hypothetical protein